MEEIEVGEFAAYNFCMWKVPVNKQANTGLVGYGTCVYIYISVLFLRAKVKDWLKTGMSTLNAKKFYIMQKDLD